jgi:HK97 family phage major capsid protein
MAENEVLPAPGDISDAEKKRREESGVASLVENIVNEQKQEWQDEIKRELEAFRAPAPKGDVLEVPDGTIRFTAPTDRIYSRMSDEERKWRNPDSDHYMAEFLRGQAYRNHGQIMTACEKLDGMFGRTALAEGAAGAVGAMGAAEGSKTIPRPLENVVLIARDKVAKMRRWAQQINMTAQTHTIPTAKAMTAYMTAEGASSTDGNPAIASVQITAQKAQVTALASNEMLADSAVNLINMWATRGGMALGALEDAQFFKEGEGTPPNISAFLAGTSYSITGGDLNFSDVSAVYFSVPQVYRQNAVWLCASDVLQFITGLWNDTAGHQFYVGMTDKLGPITDDPTAEGTLFRRPVYEVDFTNGSLYFGDPNAGYVIGTRAGLQSAVSDQVNFSADQVMWKLTQRFDGINLDTSAGQTVIGITGATP